MSTGYPVKPRRRSRASLLGLVLAFLAATALLFAAIVDNAEAAGKTVLIVAPHPDDDLLYGAGVAARALANGDTVKVVFMTNGDLLGATTVREVEGVNAQTQYIGTTEDDLMFLGYPDGGLWHILHWQPSATDVYVARQGTSATYGIRGLGRTDYHNYRFGTHATYNRANILADLEDILATYRPDDVYTTSQYDGASDHAATRWLVKTALAARVTADPTYAPTFHTTFVDWPHSSDWPASMNAAADFTEPSGLSSYTPLVWSARESFPVPTAMQSTDYPTNPKYLAVNAHVSQGGTSGILGRYIHRDEFFWVDPIVAAANSAPGANAGPAQTAIEKTVAQLDGRSSTDPDGDPLYYAWTQTGGPSVTLSDSTSVRPTFSAPAGTSTLT